MVKAAVGCYRSCSLNWENGEGRRGRGAYIHFGLPGLTEKISVLHIL